MKSKEITKAFVATAPDIINEEARTKALSEMINTFINDLHSLKEARNIQTDQGLLPIFRELDQKWNAVRRQLCKHYGVNVIIQNGFRQILKQQMPMAYEFYVGSNAA